MKYAVLTSVILITGSLLIHPNSLLADKLIANTVIELTGPVTKATPTPTSEPTQATPKQSQYGKYNNPAPLGEMVIAKTGEGVKAQYKTQMALSILKVVRGAEANKLARKKLDWLTYRKPIEGQEYIGIQIHVDVLKADPNILIKLYSCNSLTLRYTEGGEDIWEVDKVNKIKEGYPPLSAEGWSFFLIRADSQPFLYFQPDLIISEQWGDRNSGAYLILE